VRKYVNIEHYILMLYVHTEHLKYRGMFLKWMPSHISTCVWVLTLVLQGVLSVFNFRFVLLHIYINDEF